MCRVPSESDVVGVAALISHQASEVRDRSVQYRPVGGALLAYFLSDFLDGTAQLTAAGVAPFGHPCGDGQEAIVGEGVSCCLASSLYTSRTTRSSTGMLSRTGPAGPGTRSAGGTG